MIIDYDYETFVIILAYKTMVQSGRWVWSCAPHHPTDVFCNSPSIRLVKVKVKYEN